MSNAPDAVAASRLQVGKTFLAAGFTHCYLRLSFHDLTGGERIVWRLSENKTGTGIAPETMTVAARIPHMDRMINSLASLSTWCDNCMSIGCTKFHRLELWQTELMLSELFD